MNDDGTINTTFTFLKDGFDGERAIYNPTGYVTDNNAVWGMQFIWPIKAEYIIAYLSEDYQHTIIARNARDYLWIMSRSPVVADDDLAALIRFSNEIGYDIGNIEKVPHSYPTLGSKGVKQ